MIAPDRNKLLRMRVGRLYSEQDQAVIVWVSVGTRLARKEKKALAKKSDRCRQVNDFLLQCRKEKKKDYDRQDTRVYV